MLRGYQIKALNDIRECMRHHLNPCCVLPCRSGKSYIMSAIVDGATLKGKSVLILAHRRLLLHQHSNIIGGARFNTPFAEINHLGEYPKPDLIIIDEAHISSAQSYIDVCNYYGDVPRILFTATAKRLDNKPLSLCDVIINGVDADTLISYGYIAPYRIYAPKLNINLSNISIHNDFNVTELSNTMCDKKIYGDIIKYYRKYADNYQAIAYCVDIKHSKSICKLFNDNGISAIHIDSTMPEKMRNEIMDQYRNGKYMVLCNCNLISEGITLPDCDCCLLLRPTQSETLYIQQACRCLTPRNNKTAVIIDYVGNCYTHGMPTEKRTYSLNTGVKIRNKTREADIVCRECNNCLRVYPGIKPICPYCHYDNGKTRKQIEQDKQAEIEEFNEKKRKAARREVGMANDYQSLLNIGIKRGYKNPSYWANCVLTNRRKKI